MSLRSALAACTCSLVPLALGGCKTYGRVHLSQPEVHTRERLVSERARESAWIRGQLDKTEEAAQGVQGYLDTRRFTGLFAELRAGLDPDLGERNEPRQERIVAQEEARAFDAKTDELAARQRYEQALEDYEAGKKVEGGSSEEGDPIEHPSAPSAPSAPFGRKLADMPKLPSPKDIETSKVQRSALEAFHDKLAYRDAVNSALREAELDDAHDAFGFTLYELSFDLTLIPGTKSKDFVQVSVELVPDAPAEGEALESPELERLERRQKRLRELYDLWSEGLRDEMLLDIRSLQERLRSGGPIDEHNQEAKWFLKEFGPLLRHREPSSSSRTSSQEDSKDEGSQRAEVLEQVLDPDFLTRDQQTPASSATPDSEKLTILDQAVAFAVCAAYASDLEDLVRISQPSFVEHGQHIDPASVRIEKPEPVVTAHATGYSWANRLPLGGTGRETGSALFVKRLLRAEQRLTVLDVQPKEHAQTISDVAARESVLNMLLALQAVMPTKGLSAAADLQYLRREQQIVHALARKPLLVGFGRGGSRFGWVVGPRLAIVDGEPQFLHGPVRHDFSVSVSVPAWLTVLKLDGSYGWLNRGGDPVVTGNLWGDGTIELRLPLPDNVHRSITAALIGHSSSALSGLYGDTVRSRPRVDLPTKDGHADNLLIAGEKGQSLLVLGEHLWRNPQVFAGSQPASRVEVLASMNGLLAHFDGLTYPGPSTAKPDQASVQDLHVITSYGSARVVAALGILPPRPKADAKPTEEPGKALVLTSHALSPKQSELRLSHERPARFHAARIAFRPVGEQSWRHVAVGAAWKDDGQIAVVLDPRPSESCILEIMLEVQPRQGSDFQPVSSQSVRAAYFSSDADRHWRIHKGAKLELDACGVLEKGKDNLELVGPKVQDALLHVAYPGLESALKGEKVRIELSRDLRRHVLTLPARVQKTDQVFVLSIAENGLASLAQESGERPHPIEHSWKLSLHYGEGKTGGEIPLLGVGGAVVDPVEIKTVLAAIPRPSASLVRGALRYRTDPGAPPTLTDGAPLSLSLPRRSPCLESILHPWIGRPAGDVEVEARIVVRKRGLDDVRLRVRVKHEKDEHIFEVSKDELESALPALIAMLGTQPSGELSVLLQHPVPGKPPFEVEASSKLKLDKE